MGFFGGSKNGRSGPGGTGPVPVASPVENLKSLEILKLPEHLKSQEPLRK
jgi:hypothetical protein